MALRIERVNKRRTSVDLAMDDQGWRIAINSRPGLTTMGSLSQVGGGAGGF